MKIKQQQAIAEKVSPNIYKPNLNQKAPTPRQNSKVQMQTQPRKQNLFSQYVEQESKPKVETLFDADDPSVGGQRLDQIYSHLKELQAFKDEIMNDLDDFMSEIESSHVVNIPA